MSYSHGQKEATVVELLLLMFQSFLPQPMYNAFKGQSTLGCVGLYSDVSKVGNVKKPGRHFDKRDKISAWLNF